MNNDLKIIKKYYGEKMMHLCRELFPTVLEYPDLLSKTLLAHFNPSRFLYDDITVNDTKKNEFKNYIYSFFECDEEDEFDLGMSVSELMDSVGYKFYECTCEEDIQEFKKYYADYEALCTFHGGRLNTCYVFFAVKKNVDDIKRDDYLEPSREDEYGTSVISIQFSRGLVNTLSIKNRYNHKVSNPDATFSNNLENIVPGLTKAFEREYGLNINQNDKSAFYLNNYVLANDGKYYKYNYEINNVYYCPDNIIIDNFNVIRYDRERYIVMDYFIVDLKDKVIKMYDNNNSRLIYNYEDSFCEYNKNIKKIVVTNNRDDGTRFLNITTDDGKIEIVVDKYNRMISYSNDFVNMIEDNFLNNNKYLVNIKLPNVLRIENNFLRYNSHLKNINIENNQVVGDHFLEHNRCLEEEIYMPKVQSVGTDFIRNNNTIKKIFFPELKYIGSNFMRNNDKITELNLPCVEMIENDFMYYNYYISKVFMPNLKSVGNNFLFDNKHLIRIMLPSLKSVGNNFLGRNIELKYVDFPSLRTIGANFLEFNNGIRELELPMVSEIDYGFMGYNRSLWKIYVPNLKIFMLNSSLNYNYKIKNDMIKYMERKNSNDELVRKKIEYINFKENLYDKVNKLIRRR